MRLAKATLAALLPGLLMISTAPDAGAASRSTAHATARRTPCELAPQEYSLVGDTVHFTLDCPDTAGLQISWEIKKAGILTPATPGHLTLSHVFREPGRYLVYARIQDEPIPASTWKTILTPATPISPTRSSTILFDKTLRRVWAVNPDNHSVSAIDAVSLKLLFEAPVGRNPRTLALATDGSIWVANQDDATVSILDGRSGDPLATLPLPFASRPYGIAFNPAGTKAYVTLEATGALVQIDPVARRIQSSLPVCPTPRGIAVSQDGSRILVTRFLSPVDEGQVVEVEANGAAFAVKRTFSLARDANPLGSINGHGVPNAIGSVSISPDGRRAWVPVKLDNDLRGLYTGALDLTFETTVRTAVAVLDLEENQEIPSLSADLDNRSLASAVAFDRLGRFGYVAAQGSNQIDVRHVDNLDGAAALDPRSLTDELAPQGVILDDKDSLLFIHYFISRQVGVHAVGDVGKGNSIPRLALIKTVAKENLPADVLFGKRVFFNAADPRMSQDKYTSCVVCHMDGGGDGRVWDFTGRGEGLRKTISLLGRAGMGHGPVHWSANFDEIQDFEHDIRGPFGGRGFLDAATFNTGTRNKSLGDRKASLSPELDALAAYVRSLDRVPPSPYRNPDGTMTADALAGRDLFNRVEVGCAFCHGGPRFTDSGEPSMDDPVPGRDFRTAEGYIVHDVGTLKPGSGLRLRDTLMGLDTPTLKGIWQTGPYLHDGSAPDLMVVVTSANKGDRHGKTSQLSEAERRQLVAYLLQIDDLDEMGKVAVRHPQSRPRAVLRADSRPGKVRIRLQAPEGRKRPRVTLMDLRGTRLVEFIGEPGRGVWAWTWEGALAPGRRAGAGVYLLKAEFAGDDRTVGMERFVYRPD